MSESFKGEYETISSIAGVVITRQGDRWRIDYPTFAGPRCIPLVGHSLDLTGWEQRMIADGYEGDASAAVAPLREFFGGLASRPIR